MARVRGHPRGAYPFEVLETGNVDPLVIDMRPMIIVIADEARHGVVPAKIARKFHSTIVRSARFAGVCG